MTHPHRLHATAAAWSLHTARHALTIRAAVEARDIAAEQWADRTNLGVRSTVLTGGSGGYGDPISRAALGHAEPVERRNRWHTMAQTAERRITGIADLLGLDGDGDPLERILDAVPTLRPAASARLTRHLVDEDAWIRNALQLLPARQPLPGNPPCPGCRLPGVLQVQTSGPAEVWTVICTAGCRCIGPGCGCGMPVPVAGVAHIWTRTAVAASAKEAA